MYCMNNENNHSITLQKLQTMMSYAARYLYLKEKCQLLYEKLTISSHAVEVLGGLDPHSKERILAVYADAKTYLAECAQKLLQCKRVIRAAVILSDALSDAEKKTILLRLKDHSIREIANALEVTDAAVVMRIKRSGGKLTGTEEGREQFYNCLSRIKEAGLEETHERPKSN